MVWYERGIQVGCRLKLVDFYLINEMISVDGGPLCENLGATF